MKNVVHLHLHTEYSLLDGVGKIDEYLKRAKELKMEAMAITDHGNMFGVVEFYKKALKEGIKPIIGMEGYITKDLHNKDGKTYHIVLLAKNNIGYKNLMKLSSIGYIDGFYRRPRIDKKVLKKYSDGLICLTACMQGEISKVYEEHGRERVVEVVKEYLEIFSREDLYIEIQSSKDPEQIELNEVLYNIAKEMEVEVVGTNDTHYVYDGDAKLQDISICIQTGAKVADEKRMKIHRDDLFLKTREQMSRFLPKDEKILDNTLEIAKRCNVSLNFDKFLFPEFKLPSGYESGDDYLKDLVYEGLNKRYPTLSESVLERAEYELDVIRKMGYSTYFIVVWDFIKYGKDRGIPIGPGRGSAAGSLIAYALNITNIDPLKYNLIFERFLNPERISMPDIDIDICQERRGEIIDYVKNKYGEDRVAQIITFGTMKARAAVRDVSRVMDIPLKKVDKVAKLIPAFYTLDRALREVKELRELYEKDYDIQNVIEVSKGIENKVRHASIHAAGVIITAGDLTDTVPLYSDRKEGNLYSTQYQMKELEDLGLLKMDFLGLRNLTILQRTMDYINEGKTSIKKVEDIPLTDEKTYKLLQRGDTYGVFQLESQGIRNLLRRLIPNSFEDIIAVLALYRPGPLGSGMVDDYIKLKNNGGEIEYPHKDLKEVLRETYGVILYQEQVMKIANIMADYTLGEADLLRRAMGKKDSGVMRSNQEKFIKRAVEKGYERKLAEDVFELIYHFAGYGFNKSHSAAYALIAYYTAYLKTNYPLEFFAALMTSERNNLDKLAIYIEDAKRHGVRLSIPDVNRPSQNFIVDGDKIRFGMAAVKNLGHGVIEEIRSERKNGPYKNYEDFVTRTKKRGVTKKNIEGLIFSGSLDSLPGNRHEKYNGLEKVIAVATRNIKEDEIQQMNLFGGARATVERFILEPKREYPLDELMVQEKEYLGFYFSAHPLDSVKKYMDVFRLEDTKEIKEKTYGHIKTYGILRNINKIITKKSGKVMAKFDLEDYKGVVECIVFPSDYDKNMHKIIKDKKVYVEGAININTFQGKDELNIVVNKILFLDELGEDQSFKVHILVEEREKSKLLELKKIISTHPGRERIILTMKEGEKKKRVELGSEYRVSGSYDFVKEVSDLLGEDKIAIVK